uniref:Uncharacterized protein n=1 Tax=Arundo donax TaxID=35708 RepID=A0A0A9AR73_ARUDO
MKMAHIYRKKHLPWLVIHEEICR